MDPTLSVNASKSTEAIRGETPFRITHCLSFRFFLLSATVHFLFKSVARGVVSMAFEILVAIALTSMLSALGAFFLFLREDHVEILTPYLISLSAGTIFGGVFIHLVFKLANNVGYNRLTGLMVLGGILGSYLLERVVHWHCHHLDHDVEPFSLVLITGDSIHNVLDGILIASGFLVSFTTGAAATLAVVMHKIPKELGDFGILVHGGLSRLQALGFNFGISVFMFLGAGLVLYLSSVSANINAFLLPLVIGNFVYIAGSDLMPEIKEIDRNWHRHIIVFSIGVAIMYAIPFLKPLVG